MKDRYRRKVRAIAKMVQVVLECSYTFPEIIVYFTPFNIEAGEITLIPFQADSNWPFNRFGFGVGVKVKVKVKVMLRTCLMYFHARCMYKARGESV